VLTFTCACGEPVLFEDVSCGACGRPVGYDPGTRLFGNPAQDMRSCAHRDSAAQCNWLVATVSPEGMCLSCQTTRTIPDLTRPRNAARLLRLEAAKRRVLFNVQSVGLPIVPRSQDPEQGLAFDFLETLPGGPRVMTGHASGVVTINVEEADDGYRESNREALREPYRTVIGHIRHELGHYYWNVSVWGGPWHEPFRELFGDERADYGLALRNHYSNGPPDGWKQRFISSYAASHPWEDWAETFAHYLHLRSTLETVASYRLDTSAVPIRSRPFGPDDLYSAEAAHGGPAFLAWANAARVVTTVLNEASRSMGQPDTYPFALTSAVVRKLHFVHCAVHGERAAHTPVPPQGLQVPPLMA
jgi:hypothetical protein